MNKIGLLYTFCLLCREGIMSFYLPNILLVFIIILKVFNLLKVFQLFLFDILQQFSCTIDYSRDVLMQDPYKILLMASI